MAGVCLSADAPGHAQRRLESRRQAGLPAPQCKAPVTRSPAVQAYRNRSLVNGYWNSRMSSYLTGEAPRVVEAPADFEQDFGGVGLLQFAFEAAHQFVALGENLVFHVENLLAQFALATFEA